MHKSEKSIIPFAKIGGDGLIWQWWQVLLCIVRVSIGILAD